MQMKKTLLSILILTLFQHLSIAQNNPKIDSLRTVLKTSKEDTSKVNTLIACVNEYVKNDAGDSAISYGNKVLELSKRINFELGIARGYRGIGLGYRIKKDNKSAIEYFSKALTQDEKIQNKVSKQLSTVNQSFSLPSRDCFKVTCYVRTEYNMPKRTKNQIKFLKSCDRFINLFPQIYKL